ncbi:MAG: AMP-binding protein [Ignavibacteriales bacterium]|nr:AMP-binding protein [Ignavibacteriales bacterium]
MLQEKFLIDLQNSIKKNWNSPAISNYEGDTLTYGQLADKIFWLHSVFEKFNIRKQDKIAVIGKNSVNWATVYLATISYGAVIVPILSDFKAVDVQHIVNHSESKLLFSSNSIYETLDESKMQYLEAILKIEDYSILYTKKTLRSSFFEEVSKDYLDKLNGLLTNSNFCFSEISNNELATIVYTSGTTGFSKGVMLKHNSISANIRYAQRNMPLKSGDNIVSFMPLAHCYGCAFEFLFPLTMGCHITFLEKIPSPKIIIKAFQEVKPQLILSVPLVVEKIYKKQIIPVLSKTAIKIFLKIPVLSKKIYAKILSKLMNAFGNNFHEVVIGGAALNHEVENFFRKIDFPFTNGYGMTECGPLISYAGSKINKAYSVGKVVDTLEIKVDSSDSQNEVGEIWVRGENVMEGYYKNDEATNKALDKDGWLHTGDLGLIDKEGFIFLKGRCKDMMLSSSGQNIYPEEIESRLNNMLFISESLLIDRAGKLVALVYPDFEAIDAEKISENELKNKLDENLKLVNEHLPNYSKITKIEIYPEEFEKTPTKKIKRYLYERK